MKRRLFIFASTLSLLLCLATAALWIRTYFVPEVISWQDSKHQTDIVLVSGSFLVARATALPDQQDLPHWLHWEQDSRSMWGWNRMMSYDARGYAVFGQPHVTDICGYTFSTIRVPGNFDVRSLTGPILPIAAATAVMPTWWMLRIRRSRLRKRRARSGLCPQCGYDLRACSERCPECGARVRRSAEAIS